MSRRGATSTKRVRLDLYYYLLEIMATAKITEITGTREWNKWEHWPVFYISMALDNWENITLGKKKSDAFKVWDTVNYEVVEEWKKWREIKENPFKPKAYTSDNGKGAFLWMAIKIAFEKLYDPKEENYNETMALAGRIYEDALVLYNWWEEETAKNDPLPF